MTFSLDALARQLRDAEQSGQAIAPLRDIDIMTSAALATAEQMAGAMHSAAGATA